MARDIPAGRGFIELFLKDDKLQRDVRLMRRRLTRITGIVAGIGAAFTAMGIAASIAIVKATNAAGDFAELSSKFDAIFGPRADNVRKWAVSTAAALGITRKEALDTLSTFQGLFIPLGIDAGIAEDLSKQLTTLSVDLASFENVASADVVRDLSAALTGSSETMRKYKVVVDEAAVKQQLLRENINPKEATNAQKVMARLTLILGSTVTAQGDAIRTADSYNNQLKRLGATIEEIKIEIGEKFLPLMRDLASLAVTGMQELREAINNNMPDFGELDKRILELAKSGSWELAGELIAFQLKKGLRSGLGPELFDAFEFGATSGLFGLAGMGTFRAGRERMGQTVEALQQFGSATAGPFQGGGEALSSRRETQLAQEEVELNKRIVKVLESIDKNTKNREGLRLP